MMGQQKSDRQLFNYAVNLEKRVRANHPLRQVKAAIDFRFVREEVAHCYGKNGNESVDPIVILKMMFLLFFEDIKSERELMEMIAERLDYLWFLDYGLDEQIPDHSVLSKARTRFVVSELGALDRFTHPRQVMAYLGLVPSEKSSSNRRRQGAITKCGNAHARWLLVECAQHYAAAPKVSKELSQRQQNQSRAVRTLSWKAQNRLHQHYRRLMARRLLRNKVIVAVARELCGFIWELLRTQECYHAPAPSGMK